MAAGSYAQKKAFKIIVVGSVGVGKTCILDRYVKGKYSKDHKSTLGTGVHSKTMEVDGTQIVMQIYDTAGQERFDSLVATYYRGSDAAFIVYDVSDRRSFEDVQTWYGKLRQHVPRPDGFPILVVGNKVDKPAESHQVTEEEGKQLVLTHIPGAEHMRVREMCAQRCIYEPAFRRICFQVETPDIVLTRAHTYRLPQRRTLTLKVHLSMLLARLLRGEPLRPLLLSLSKSKSTAKTTMAVAARANVSAQVCVAGKFPNNRFCVHIAAHTMNAFAACCLLLVVILTLGASHCSRLAISLAATLPASTLLLQPWLAAVCNIVEARFYIRLLRRGYQWTLSCPCHFLHSPPPCAAAVRLLATTGELGGTPYSPCCCLYREW